jgi:hypothetical protein
VRRQPEVRGVNVAEEHEGEDAYRPWPTDEVCHFRQAKAYRAPSSLVYTPHLQRKLAGIWRIGANDSNNTRKMV